MRKINKVVAGMMLFGMGAGVAGALPTNNINTVSAQTTNSFTVSGFKTELEIGDNVTLPEISGVTRTVIDPMGNVLTLTNNVLSATKLGTYTVRYVKNIENSNGKTVQEYKITVTGDKPQLKFSANNSRIIPETTNFENDIVLPVPTVVDSEGEEIANAEVSVVVTAPDHTQTVVTYQELTADTGYTVDVNKEGIYTITYKYINSNNTLAYKTYTVTAKESYDASNIVLTHTLNSAMPTSINLGSEVTLPSVIVKDENNSNATISAYYSIKVVHVDSNTTYTVNENNKFVPMHEGQYRVTYTINDFFGSKLKGTTDNTYTYTIDKCTDTLAPTPMVVNAYTQTAVTGEENAVRVDVDSLENAESSIISKVYYTENSPATVSFPAIFATDDYEVQKVTDSNVEYYKLNKNNVTLIRKLVNENGTTIKTWSSADSEVNANEAVTYEFNKAGSYKIEYTAKDASGNSKTATYAFEVVEGLTSTDNSAPTITFDDLQLSYATAGQTISFKKPTVVDYLNNNVTDKVIGDTRIETSSYYYFNEDIANKVKIEEDKNNSENLSFTLPQDLTGKTKVTVITYARDDYNPETSNSYVINLIGGTTDADAPTISTGELVLSGDTYVDATESTIDQLKTVNIADITLTDADEYFGAQLSVRYFKNAEDELGTEVSLASVSTVYDRANKTITLKNASFVATNVGTYVVTVIGQDLTGNTIVKSTTVKTNDVVAPEIFVNWNYTKVELGKSVTLPQVKVYDNGVLLPNAPVTIEVSGPSYKLNGYQFTPLVKGNYTVKYISQDASSNKVESQTYTIYAEDTVKPEIEINEVFPETADLVADTVNGGYTAIRIPGFTPSDANGINWAETKVTVKKSSVKYDVTSIEDGNAYTFIPTGNGSYTVTYTAVDSTGLKTETIKTIKVGDVTAPTIAISNTAKNKPGSKKVGDKLVLDLNSITITDAKDSALNGITLAEAMEDDSISAYVYVYDANGNIVEKTTEEDSEYYQLSKQGTYRIEYKVTDANGNTATETHSFTVNAKASAPKITSESLGIILIVASLLLLGGVITYFFATRKVVRRPKKD